MMNKTLDQEGNCTCCPFCGESKSKGRCSCGMTCHSSETERLENSSTMPVPIDMQEPLGIGVLEDCSRSNYYTTILKRWSGEIMQKIIDWLNNKSGIKKHVDTVKVFIQFFDITRRKNKSLIDHVTRFEENCAEVQRTGRSLSSTCRTILTLKQADLTDVNLQIITANLEFDPIPSTASMHYNECKTNMEKFQHNQESEEEIPSFNVKEAEAEPQPLQKFFEISQQEDESKAQEYCGMTSQQFHTDEESDDDIEKCPKPNPTKVKAYRKRKEEQAKKRSARCQQEDLEQNLEGISLTTFAQNSANLFTREESEEEILSFTVKEAEAEPQPLQKFIEILQQGDEHKAQEYCGKTCQQFHTDEESEDDYCLCDCYPRWEPFGCARSSQDKEECSKPNPIKVKTYRKRKAKQAQKRSHRYQQEDSEQNLEGLSLTTFAQDSANLFTQEESEEEILSFIIKEVEPKQRPLQKSFKILQQEDESKAQEYYGMTRQQFHMDEESKDEVISFAVKIEVDIQDESKEEILSSKAEGELQPLQELAKILQDEPEEETLSFIVKEAEVKLRPLQELAKILQDKSEDEVLPLIVKETEVDLQEKEEPKAQGYRDMISQRIQKNGRKKRTYSENTIIKHRHQKDREDKQKLIRPLDCGPPNTIIGMERSENGTLSLIFEEAKLQLLQEPFELLQPEENPGAQEQRGMTCHQIRVDTRGHVGELVVDGKQHYDTQKNSGQVLQKGTKAITRGKPGLWPVKPSPLTPTTQDGNKSEAKEEDMISQFSTVITQEETEATIEHRKPVLWSAGSPTPAPTTQEDGEHQLMPNLESLDNQQNPANFTPPNDLGSLTMRNQIRERTSREANPTHLIHKSEDQTVCIISTKPQVGGPLITGQKNIMKSVWQEVRRKLKPGSLENLPFGFQDLIDGQNQKEELMIYGKHPWDNLETPHRSQLNNRAKQDVPNQDPQSTYGSPIAKANIHNNTAVEMIAKQRIFNTIFFTRTAPEERHRQKARESRGVALSDLHKLSPNINQPPTNVEDSEPRSNTLKPRLSIKWKKPTQEACTPTLHGTQIGQRDLPSGIIVENSAEQLAKTWPKLIRTEQPEERTQDEKNKTEAFFTPVRTKSSDNNMPGEMSTSSKNRLRIEYKDLMTTFKDSNGRLESQDRKEDPANSTPPIDLSSPTMRHPCNGKISRETHSTLLIHKSEDLPLVFQNLINQSLTYTEDFGPRADTLELRASIEQKRPAQEASIPISQETQIGRQDLPNGTTLENSAGTLAMTWPDSTKSRLRIECKDLIIIFKDSNGRSESQDQKEDPANSTPPIDLGFPTMRYLCKGKNSREMHSTLLIHKSKDLPLAFQNLINQSLTYTKDFGPRSDTLELRTSIEQKRPAQEASIPISQETQTGRQDLPNGTSIENSVGTLAMTWPNSTKSRLLFKYKNLMITLKDDHGRTENHEKALKDPNLDEYHSIKRRDEDDVHEPKTSQTERTNESTTRLILPGLTGKLQRSIGNQAYQ